MMIKQYSLLTLFFLASLCILSACASTQKTAGAGLASVVAQNVVRIAGVQAMNSAQLSTLEGQKTYVKITGFVDERNEKFIDTLVRSEAEKAGALLVSENNANLVLEAVVNSAGNDQGNSKVPLVMRSERTEGSVDLELILRNADTGERISVQNVRGVAKYEQATVVGFQGSGEYFVKDLNDRYVKVEDPNSFR